MILIKKMASIEFSTVTWSPLNSFKVIDHSNFRFYKFYEDGLYTWYNQIGLKKTSKYFVDQICNLRKQSFINSRFHKFHVISLENLHSLFAVYFILIVISAATFIIEFIVYFLVNRSSKNLKKRTFIKLQV